MEVLLILLLLAAIVFFVLAAFGVKHPPVHFGWLGAACVAGVFLLERI